ncbi:MAG TPA: hypothetical protein VJJ54_08065 [Gemmatimonadales bacterium]|nr:hypothetical protein [Gemmatimonadales bacterium]
MRAVRIALVTLAIAGSAPLHAQHRSSSLLSFEDIDRLRANSSAAHTAYDVVQMLRPRWLQKREPLPATPRAAFENPPVIVYVNDVSMGGTEFLKGIPVETVLELRWLSPNEAAGRYGRSDGLAAIVVTLKR